jgi:hypothetical protein
VIQEGFAQQLAELPVQDERAVTSLVTGYLQDLDEGLTARHGSFTTCRGRRSVGVQRPIDYRSASGNYVRAFMPANRCETNAGRLGVVRLGRSGRGRRGRSCHATSASNASRFTANGRALSRNLRGNSVKCAVERLSIFFRSLPLNRTQAALYASLSKSGKTIWH